MKGFRKLLIAANGSGDIVRKGIQLAKEERSWVTVVKVVPEFEGDLELIGIKNISDVLDSEGRKAIDEANRTAGDERALINTRLETGDIDKKIVEVAREERCDLIIMENDRRGFFWKLLGGNVVEKVIEHAPCPVLVVG